jgi:hypothetical protein
MNKISRKKIRVLAEAILFENSSQINLPVDDGMYVQNTRTGQENQPYQPKEVPLAPNNLVKNQSLLVKNFDENDKEYVPANKSELSIAISSILNNVDNNEMSEKEIDKVWRLFTKTIRYVKEK